jgi:hypothetical protein
MSLLQQQRLPIQHPQLCHCAVQLVFEQHILALKEEVPEQYIFRIQAVCCTCGAF